MNPEKRPRTEIAEIDSTKDEDILFNVSGTHFTLSSSLLKNNWNGQKDPHFFQVLLESSIKLEKDADRRLLLHKDPQVFRLVVSGLRCGGFTDQILADICNLSKIDLIIILQELDFYLLPDETSKQIRTALEKNLVVPTQDIMYFFDEKFQPIPRLENGCAVADFVRDVDGEGIRIRVPYSHRFKLLFQIPLEINQNEDSNSFSRVRDNIPYAIASENEDTIIAFKVNYPLHVTLRVRYNGIIQTHRVMSFPSELRYERDHTRANISRIYYCHQQQAIWGHSDVIGDQMLFRGIVLDPLRKWFIGHIADKIFDMPYCEDTITI